MPLRAGQRKPQPEPISLCRLATAPPKTNPAQGAGLDWSIQQQSNNFLNTRGESRPRPAAPAHTWAWQRSTGGPPTTTCTDAENRQRGTRHSPQVCQQVIPVDAQPPTSNEATPAVQGSSHAGQVNTKAQMMTAPLPPGLPDQATGNVCSPLAPGYVCCHWCLAPVRSLTVPPPPLLRHTTRTSTQPASTACSRCAAHYHFIPGSLHLSMAVRYLGYATERSSHRTGPPCLAA